MSTSTQNKLATTNAISSAVAEGLNSKAGDILVANLNDTVLMGCIGASIDDLDATEATLFAVAIDASASMEPYRRLVIEAYNTMLKALKGSKAASSILVSTWTFNDQPNLLHGYVPVSQVPDLDLNSYRPGGMTALYDTVVNTMTGLVAYGQDLLNNGVPNRRILFVLSDGDDNQSSHRSHEVKTASKGLIAQEAYTLAYAGFGSADLKQQADEIGFSEVITTGSTESEMRKIFHQVSQSVIRVSQGANSAGGFF